MPFTVEQQGVSRQNRGESHFGTCRALLSSQLQIPGINNQLVKFMVALLHPLGAGKQIPIDRAVVVVGRSPDCDSVLDISSKISRMHCALIQVDNTFHIRDLGSMNGVWVNGKRVDRQQQLQNGAKVAIGDVQFKFYQNVQPASRGARKVAPADASQHVPVLIEETLTADAIDDVVELVEVVEAVELIDDVIELNEQSGFSDQNDSLDAVEVVDIADAAYDSETVNLKYNAQQGAEAEFCLHDSVEVVEADEPVEVIEEFDIIEDVDVVEEVDVIESSFQADLVDVIEDGQFIEVVEDIHVVEEIVDEDLVDVITIDDAEVIEDVDQVDVVDDADVIEDVQIIHDVEVIDEPEPPFQPRPRRRRR